MKKITLGLILLGLVTSALAVDKEELDDRIRKLTENFGEMQRDSDKSIPADELRKAQGIILLDRTKAGIVFAFQGGSGVALVKDPKNEQWSPAAFVSANEASLGFQVGGQQSFVVILLMDTNALQMLTQSKMKFSGEAGGTVGDVSGGQQTSFSKPVGSVRVYTDRIGIFGGAALKGGALKPDNQANKIYYGQFLTLQDIVFEKKVQPSETTEYLVKKLVQYSKEKRK